MKYLAPEVDLIGAGPHISVYTNSKGLETCEEESFKGKRWLLANWHEEQTVVLLLEQGRLQSDKILLITWELACPNRQCHRAELLTTELKEEKELLEILWVLDKYFLKLETGNL